MVGETRVALLETSARFSAMQTRSKPSRGPLGKRQRYTGLETCEACGGEWAYVRPSTGRTERATLLIVGEVESAIPGKMISAPSPGRRVRVCMKCNSQMRTAGTFERVNVPVRSVVAVYGPKLKAMLDAGLTATQIARALNVNRDRVRRAIDSMKASAAK